MIDVTFLTNEDEDAIDESIKKLTKDITDLKTSLGKEVWEFEMEDGSVETKTVIVEKVVSE